MILRVLVVLIGVIMIPYIAIGETISGSFALRMGKTEFPIYPRGDGNMESWQFDQNLKLRGKTLEFMVRSRLIGGTIMDNPDQFAFDFDLKRYFGKSFVVLFHDDAYALNRNPVLDFSARIPNSSVNSWQIGLGRGPLQARYTFAGVTPLYYGYHTKPYVRYSVHADWICHLTRSLTWETQASLTASKRLRPGHATVVSGLWVPLSPRLRLGGEYLGRFNFAVPKRLGGRTDLPDRIGFFAALEASFGKR